MSIVIRPALKSELTAVYQLEHAVFADHCYPDFFFRQSFDCWPSGLLVAVDKHQQVLGYLLAVNAECADTLWILSVAVSPEARGQGLGRQLMAHCLAHVSPVITNIKLTVSPHNSACSLYQSLGFVVQANEADYFSMGEARHLMVWLR